MKEAERRVTWGSKLDSDLAGSCALAEADLAPILYANTDGQHAPLRQGWQMGRNKKSWNVGRA